ncbi:MAG: hypothetical protein WC456_01815 [Patescibacteria group bacterium]
MVLYCPSVTAGGPRPFENVVRSRAGQGWREGGGVSNKKIIKLV